MDPKERTVRVLKNLSDKVDQMIIRLFSRQVEHSRYASKKP